MNYTGENIFEKFIGDILDDQESAKILGGSRKKKSRDRDIYDLDEDDDD